MSTRSGDIGSQSHHTTSELVAVSSSERSTFLLVGIGDRGKLLAEEQPSASVLGGELGRAYAVHTKLQEKPTLCISSETIFNNSAIEEVDQRP